MAVSRDEDDFRRLSDFPSYMVNRFGEVRRLDTGRQITPIIRGWSEYVRLYRRGEVYIRSVRRLVEENFDGWDFDRGIYVENDGIRSDSFVPIPDFPNYEIDRLGQVRNLRSGEEIYPYNDGFRVYYQLFRGGKRYNRGIKGLVERTFPDYYFRG